MSEEGFFWRIATLEKNSREKETMSEEGKRGTRSYHANSQGTGTIAKPLSGICCLGRKGNEKKLSPCDGGEPQPGREEGKAFAAFGGRIGLLRRP